MKSVLSAAPATPKRQFDVTISLYNNPAGDNVRTTVDERTKYEQIIEYFADAVFESSEGLNQIRNVYVYTNGKFADKADIVWEASGHPHANLAGVGIPGMKISMYDTFAGGGSGGSDYNLLTD